MRERGEIVRNKKKKIIVRTISIGRLGTCPVHRGSEITARAVMSARLDRNEVQFDYSEMFEPVGRTEMGHDRGGKPSDYNRMWRTWALFFRPKSEREKAHCRRWGRGIAEN